MLTAFSWGYAGWGNSIPQLLRSFDTAEQLRGFRPPVFVDVRARRNVRAKGFRDDAFEHVVERRRYRWMKGLGNEAVRTGKGTMRLVQPEQSLELLDLVVSEAGKKSRVIFFCSCDSPSCAHTCHRRLVRAKLLAEARRQGVGLRIEEWPGGEPTAHPCQVQVPQRTIDTILRGGTRVRVPESIALERSALPHGQVVDFTDGKRHQLVACGTPIYRAGRWALPIFVLPVNATDSAQELSRHSKRFRSVLGL